MGDVVWVCSLCKNKTDWDTGNKRKLFERYVDDIICTVKDHPDKLLNRVDKLHKNLEFTIERLNDHRELAFLDMTVHVDINRKITCKWYQKHPDTDTTPNFQSCAPLQHKKMIIEGTVHRLLRCTSDWNYFDKALKINEIIWKKNQYPESWSSKVVNKILEKIITQPPKLPAPKTLKQPRVEKVDEPMFFLQYRGNLSRRLRKKIRKEAEINVIYTTRKLKTCLPTVKSAFDKSLKSHVVYENTCSGCNSTYVGQTYRHITTRIIEHQKADSPVGQHVSECCGTAKAFNWRIIDQSSEPQRPYIYGSENQH